MGKKFSKKKNLPNKKKLNISKDNKFLNNHTNNNIKGYENTYKDTTEKKNVIHSDKKDIEFNSNKINYEFITDIATDSYSYGIDNTMVTFKSIDDILYFIYSKKISIISYDLINNKKINEIKDDKNSCITNLKHYFHQDKRQDLVISTSINNNLKLWKINNWECLLNIKRVNLNGDLRSACFLSLNNQIYILTSNIFGSEPIKVFNLKGKKIREIPNSKDGVNYIDIYYDNKSSKPYILTGNKNFVKSYDYNNNIVYHTYNDNDHCTHYSLRIKNENNLIKLIESSEDGNIRIWDFHSGKLLKKIYISDGNLFGICLWNNDYLFIGCGENTIKILDMEKSQIIGKIDGHNRGVLVLLKVNIPKYGECLISQENGELTKLWKIKLNN